MSEGSISDTLCPPSTVACDIQHSSCAPLERGRRGGGGGGGEREGGREKGKEGGREGREGESTDSTVIIQTCTVHNMFCVIAYTCMYVSELLH